MQTTLASRGRATVKDAEIKGDAVRRVLATWKRGKQGEPNIASTLPVLCACVPSIDCFVVTLPAAQASPLRSLCKTLWNLRYG